eukprot:CAMPEP_0176443308 /NCGR_PEP_ID=MMETSP0127-20121128/22344_1 /TAXON_ID=938130 /ORGANISM="Platyophrya macrostoma, Strain WH" /LENGTH=247 /DNA_ID=CAMNT_0017828509 /DNA_START=425 /DNA_END=1168 /DNA_ORIENTATION=+
MAFPAALRDCLFTLVVHVVLLYPIPFIVISIATLPVVAVDRKAEALRHEFRTQTRILLQGIQCVKGVQRQIKLVLLHHGACRRGVGLQCIQRQRLVPTHQQKRDRALVAGVPGLQQRPPRPRVVPAERRVAVGVRVVARGPHRNELHGLSTHLQQVRVDRHRIERAVQLVDRVRRQRRETEPVVGRRGRGHLLQIEPNRLFAHTAIQQRLDHRLEHSLSSGTVDMCGCSDEALQLAQFQTNRPSQRE